MKRTEYKSLFQHGLAENDFKFHIVFLYPKVNKYIPVTKNINGIISMYFRENVFVTFV